MLFPLALPRSLFACSLLPSWGRGAGLVVGVRPTTVRERRQRLAWKSFSKIHVFWGSRSGSSVAKRRALVVGILRSQSGTSEVNSWLSGKDLHSNGLDFTPLGALMF